MKILSNFLKKIKPQILISAIIAGAFAGALASFLILSIQNSKPKSNEELIKDFYLTENAVYVSPHGLRKNMDKGDTGFVLVDLRSNQEYEKEHIVGAVNIPAYKDPETSAYDEEERIVTSFQNLPQDKEIIVYCYSMPCMTGRKIGKLLAEHGLYVKHLGIGWNEWRYFWNLWNHDMEEPAKVEDYVVSGKEPGTPKQQELPAPCGEGEFSC